MQPPKKILVTVFSADPEKGSEKGTGAGILEAASNLACEHGWKLIILHRGLEYNLRRDKPPHWETKRIKFRHPIDKLLYLPGNLIGGKTGNLLNHAVFWTIYDRWLHRCAQTAAILAKNGGIELAIHGSLTGLKPHNWLKTALGETTKVATFCAANKNAKLWVKSQRPSDIYLCQTHEGARLLQSWGLHAVGSINPMAFPNQTVPQFVEPENKEPLSFVILESKEARKNYNKLCNWIAQEQSKGTLHGKWTLLGEENRQLEGKGPHWEIQVTGKVSRLTAIETIAKSQFIVNASHREGTPTSMLEAFCCGTIPIATKLGWTEGVQGIFFDSTKSLSFQDTITQAHSLHTNRELMLSMGTSNLKLTRGLQENQGTKNALESLLNTSQS